MTTTLSDLLPHLGDLTPEAAERWVAAALAEAAALREYDDRLYPLSDGGAVEAARLLHEAWRRWADQAESLVARLGHGGARGQHVLGLDDLRFVLGRARALRTLPPGEVLRRRDRAQSESTLPTTGEVRRELGLAPRA